MYVTHRQLDVHILSSGKKMRPRSGTNYQSCPGENDGIGRGKPKGVVYLLSGHLTLVLCEGMHCAM